MCLYFATGKLRCIELATIASHLAKLLLLQELHSRGISSVLGRKCEGIDNAAQRLYLHSGRFSPGIYYTAAHLSASVLPYAVAIPAD